VLETLPNHLFNISLKFKCKISVQREVIHNFKNHILVKKTVRILISTFTVPNNRKTNRRTQNPSKSLKKTAFEAKGRQFTTGTVIQRLFNIDSYKYLAIYRYGQGKR